VRRETVPLKPGTKDSRLTTEKLSAGCLFIS
jgi:hypothetical protein